MSVYSKIKILVTGLQEELAASIGTLYGVIPNNTSADQVVTRALDTATKINSSGTIETVVANKARIDYSLGVAKCPNLLIEKTHIEIARYTESSDSVEWVKDNTTVVANCILSPDGTVDADNVYPSSTGSTRQIYQSNTYVNASTYTNSYRLKYNGIQWVYCYGVNAGVASKVWIDLLNGVVGTIQGDVISVWLSPIDSKGFYTVYVTETATSTSGYLGFGLADANNSLSVTASGTNGVYVWGYNSYAGSVPLSYVPRLNNTAVTCNADVIIKTGLSAVIPQIKGALFADFYLQAGSLAGENQNRRVLVISQSGALNAINIGRYENILRVQATQSGIDITDISIKSPFKNKRVKLVVCYNLTTNVFLVYINGALVKSLNTFISQNTMALLEVGSYNGVNQWDGLIKSVGVTDELTATDIDQLVQYNSLEEMASEMVYNYEV